jgi:hypothetical protein
MSVKITIDKVPGIQKALKDLGSARVMVGIPAKAAQRDPHPGETKTPNNAELGYIHEFGAPEMNIPARPFLMPGIENKKEPIVNKLKAAGQAALDGKPEIVQRHLVNAGETAVAGVQDRCSPVPSCR